MKRHWITLVTALAICIQAAVYLLVLRTLRQNSSAPAEGSFILAQIESNTQANQLHLTPAQALDQALHQGQAQTRTGGSLRDTSLLKLPPGAPVAIFEFEDMECPWDARAHPLVQSAANSYHLPLLRRDLPITRYFTWSFDAAVTARYIQDKVSPALAETFRTDLFANQTHIATQQDLADFSRNWFLSHGLTLPSAMDDSRKKVIADSALASRIGVDHTPSIYVVTAKQVALTDVDQLDQTIHSALAQTSAAPSQNHSSNPPR